jgi:YidC/Oxa1 family membrane protein insertase
VEKRLLLFLPLAFGIYILSVVLEANRRAANQPAAKPDAVAHRDAGKAPGDKNAADKAAADKGAGDKKVGNAEAAPANPANVENKNPAPGAKPAEEEKPIPNQWFPLGSLDSNHYKMLVLITNQGAAVERIELADPRYRDIDPENRFGYLGHLALVADKDEKGCRVNVVGDGTPAAIAGVKVGDVIVELNGQKTAIPDQLLDVLRGTKPGEAATIHVRRAGADQQLAVTLGWRPLAVVRPEFDTNAVEQSIGVKHDPLSFLTTLREIDKEEIPADANKLNGEIDGVHLRSANWEGTRIDNDTVEFTRRLPKWGLKVIKRYRLAKISTDKPDEPAYHLMLHVEIQNESDQPHSVAYQQDGPTGLPTEGWWYASRIGVQSLRDVAVKLQNNGVKLVDGLPLAQRQSEIFEARKAGKEPPKKDDSVEGPEKENEQLPLTFAGVDAQYFAAIMLPQHPAKFTPWLTDVRAIAVGEEPPEPALRKKIDVTCRLSSYKKEIAPGDRLAHEYQVFVGPKLPPLLEEYSAPGNKNENLKDLVYYGWFWWVAQPMVAVLEMFHSIIGSYGLAIIMLTVLVRLCMFPLSRKQALSAKKMQELQPEMKKINEKYKSNAQEKTRATQELWRKHNYNPLGGCLLVFVQLPIFMGLYRSLMVNVQLRQASLLGEAVRWCSNLAAPDMFWNWSSVMPAFFSAPTGWLGPYLNILPLITVSLFIWQQSMFMPPATDDNTALQQKIMKYMTLFMGVMFFKVAAGLCIYFIASSLWGIAERKLLPKMVGTSQLGSATTAAARPALSSGSNNGSPTAQHKKQRGRK